MKLNNKGLLIVLSGPSGVGKGTVRKALFDSPDHKLVYSVSMTTRNQRPGEVDGLDYYFVTKEEFENRIENDMFLEYANFIGNYYGTPFDKVDEMLKEGHEVVLEIEVEGALKVREKLKDAVFIFIVPPTKQALYDRLRGRGTESEEVIAQRVAKADREFEIAHKYDYIVVNDEIDRTVARIKSIINAEHSRTERSIHQYYDIFNNKGEI